MAKKAKTVNQDATVVDLTDVLSREVKVDVPPVVITHDEPVQEAIFEEIETETIIDDDENNSQHQYQDADPGYQEPGEIFMSPTDIAENIVNLLDGLQSSAIPYLRKKNLFTEKELELLQKIDHSAVYDANSREFYVLQKWKRHLDVIKEVPFSDGESRRLKQATARYAATTNMQVTPFQGLIMAYSEVVINRVKLFTE